MTIINAILDILWGPATPAIIIAVAVYFTIRTKFVQIRRLPKMLELLKANSEQTTEGISGFQSFMISVAGRVGTGNVAGVAGAIAYGGPGAVIWMCIAAILGAATSFIESSLAQIYKVRYGEGEFRGGTTYYIEKGLGLRWLAVLFSVLAYFAQGFGFHLPNMSSIVYSIRETAGIAPMIPTIITAILFALIVFGGVKRIGSFADKAVPFMSLIYIGLCIVVLVTHVSVLPATISLMIDSAFNPKSFLGGMLGSAITWGVKRGLYSNEAGLGSATCAAGSSDVSHPAQEGLTQALAVYFDTLIICLIGAVTIIATNSYNVIDGSGEMIVSNIPEISVGVLYVQTAITGTVGTIGAYLLSICVWFFCFTSIVAFHYYGEVNIGQIFKNHPKGATIFARVVSVIAIFVGGLTFSDFAWAIGDLSLGLMAFINIPVILLLSKYAFKALDDYERQLASGVEKITFYPEKLGIKGTEPNLWNELSSRE
ncbi:MAG: alanine/glycine:cation symporter family protein [Tissierellia bacterium]|nr:alanine/glycine:cation symporter family protein [Tissierellia bacterium]